ncbi:hypothetical protein Lesp02_76320 [Lentzea sp. NBRC 105346]|uniref:hypothetical protein n=1 Tax=Lentzea sp. NBRC 105346 TaxID=3032205 RepID=UPI0024A48B48|nr:hypothetical protein [Lentzea sp. NBRC 105346]GLZ35445.1 hypothetical protein Lesp02_76320 [Lentzea sp. NBRC 105346]
MRKAKGLFGIVSSVAAGAGAFSSFKAAREDKDKLALANAIASLAVAITGAALAVRGLRKDSE